MHQLAIQWSLQISFPKLNLEFSQKFVLVASWLLPQCMYVCVYVCMCVCMCVCSYVMCVCSYVCMYVYSIVQYSIVWYGMVWYGMVWYGIVQYSIVQYSIVSEYLICNGHEIYMKPLQVTIIHSYLLDALVMLAHLYLTQQNYCMHIRIYVPCIPRHITHKLINCILVYSTFEINHGWPWFISNVP